MTQGWIPQGNMTHDSEEDCMFSQLEHSREAITSELERLLDKDNQASVTSLQEHANYSNPPAPHNPN